MVRPLDVIPRVKGIATQPSSMIGMQLSITQRLGYQLNLMRNGWCDLAAVWRLRVHSAAIDDVLDVGHCG